MHTRTGVLALLLAVGMTATPAVRGQDYAPPDPIMPLPLYSNRPAAGGAYVVGEFLFFRQTDPIKGQIIAMRGLFDADGSISQALGRPNPRPGTFIGNGQTALEAGDIGQGTYVPGYNVAIGWRLRNGTAIELGWMHLQEASYAASAGIEPFAFRVGRNLAETFLTAPVYNFPVQFAGPAQKVAIGNPGATFGIWNAASEMQLRFIQRFDQFQLQGRIPVWEDDNNRAYGLVAPRVIHMWERFSWRTTSRDLNSNAGPQDTALYSNVASNNLYGVFVGCGDECRLGDSPIGTFACSLDLGVAVLVDFATLVAKYERADGQIAAKRARKDYSFVPEFTGQVNLWYYPIEGVQLRVGYSAMAFFNTFGSPNPVNFNVGGIDATYERLFRYFNGLNAGIGFIF